VRITTRNLRIRRSTKWALLLFLFTCLQISQLSVETKAQIVCRVASLDSPSEMAAGQPFTLKVTVDYSFPYGTYSLKVMVYKGGLRDFSSFVAESTSVEISGAGSQVSSIGLTAPYGVNEWALTAYACYRRPYETTWYYLPDRGGYRTFAVLIYTKCQVSLKTNPSEVARHAKMLGEGEYDPNTSVTLKVDRIVQGPAGTRYVFLFWTVEGQRYDTETQTIRIVQRRLTATAEFKVQHQLVVKSEFGNPQGSGWFDEGSVATFFVTSPVGFGIQQVFERWSGDSTSTSPSSTIVMNSPKTVVAVWRADYTIAIVAILGVVGASGAAIGFIAYSRKKRAAAPAAPLGVVHPEAAPAGVAAKPVPEAAPSAVKEVKEVPTPKIIPIAEVAPPLDERVYNYIVEHEGTIALSQAAKDLGITVDELNAAIDRLKSQGRLA